MKIKFEIKSSPNSQTPLYTIFCENKTEDVVELKMTRFNLRQQKFGEEKTIAQKQDIPIEDGIITMSKANLKKFISALQLLAKS